VTTAPTDHPPAAFPMTDLEVVDRLGRDLRAAGYTATGVPELLGSSAHRALSRGEMWPALRATGDGSPLETLVRLFLLGTTESEKAVARAFPRAGLAAALASGALERDGAEVRAALDIRPHADDANEYLVVSDLDSDTRPGPVRQDHVLGIGQASITLAGAVIREQTGSVMDLGTGCGIQALHAFSHSASIVATDTNPRALALAGATARLNGQCWDLRHGSLFDPVEGDRFDLIISNPPFVIGTGIQQYSYRDSGIAGDGVCQALVAGMPAHLQPGGTAQMLANWIVRDHSDWRERVGGWVYATGCDAWVVQREMADPAEYIALWLKDAGEVGGQATTTAAEWLDYFAAERVTAIGMGMITLRRSGSDDPDVVLDEITGAGEEVTGPEAAAFLARRAWLRDASDEALLGTRLSLAPSVILERQSLAAREGWSTVLRLLRRPGGPGATLQVDDWGQSLLSGCTGDLPLAVLLDLMATAHGLDIEALARNVLPTIRVCITRGLLDAAQA
jgi:methylase of polypeptide subunit release factors